MRSLHAFGLCLVLVSPLPAQTNSIPWDILSSRTIVTPFFAGGIINTKLAPNGDVFISASPCAAPGIVKLTSSYGTPSPCDTVIARVNSAGNFVFAIQLGGIDDQGPTMLLDPAGNLYVGGFTDSPSRFLTTPGAYLPTSSRPTISGFVCKLAAADGTPMFCTFLDVTATLAAVDAAGDLLFTQLFSSTPSGNSYSILKLDPTGAKLLLQSVPVDGAIGSFVPNADGTFYLSGETQSPQFPFSIAPAVPPSDRQPSFYYGKFDPNKGFLFAQDFGSNQIFVTLQPSVGPLLAGYFGSGFEVRQYASDGTTIVYDRSLPLYLNGKLSVVDGGVVLAGFATSAALPLVHNLHVCGQLLSPNGSIGPLMIRLDKSGAIVQSTWLGANSFGSLVQAADGSWSALGSTSNSAYGDNFAFQVLSVGPSPTAQPQIIGCMADLAQGTKDAVTPGLLVALTIENDASAGPAIAQPDSSGRYPTSLAGITITFDGVPMPLFALNGSQLTGAVPFSVAGKSTSQMCLKFIQSDNCAAVQITPLAPSAFPGVVNQDGTINSPDHPAPSGSIISFYMVGLGPLSPPAPDGMIVNPPLPQLATQVRVEFATGVAMFPIPSPPPIVAQVTYAGPAPFEVAGVYQINARVPTGVFGRVTITVGSVQSSVINVSLSN